MKQQHIRCKTFENFKKILTSRNEGKNFMKDIAAALIKSLTRDIKTFTGT